ncbi:MAG TPA: Crp/Fnr family transcriptional regulator [Candidatus Avacidaminococcus intestinavium]|uniref:Crp/Fnr family transcriptional regulator n=1 Tax=Candidatus Avacidaminococcus intestinavium TaxID=2840684 RepID=A0A9D1MPP1_9FIRM|nr:Crp/Fnr family transcriptional regulator [Candidatus Avacidaminococcus intestinavium]
MRDKGALQGKLFRGMSLAETEQLLESLGARVVRYKKGMLVFQEEDTAANLYVLVRGKVAIGKNSYLGKQMMAAIFTEPGEMFGEVYAFLDKPFEYFALVEQESEILEVPLTFLSDSRHECTVLQNILLHNLLNILAEKAYFLNRKLQVMASGNLRQKLVKLLLDSADQRGVVRLAFSRQGLAEYLSVARPSLSRELMSMQKEGLIVVSGKQIVIQNQERLENYL